MKLSIISGAILSALAAGSLVSCSSDSDTASSGTADSTVVGTIVGFGSIIMDNGVKYETDGLSDCEVDDVTVAGLCEDSLSTGMHVTLQTDANGNVISLYYDDEIEGAVTAGSVTGENGDFSFDVFGVTVTTTNPGTQWDDFNGNPPTAGELDGANIEISGEWQLDGSLLASYIEQQDDSSHEIEGVVGAITGTDFPLTLKGGVTIDVDGSALGLLPAEGDFIELEGSYIEGMFVATGFELEDEDDFDEDSEAEITGTLIADDTSSTGFSIGSTDVDISAAPSCNGLTGTVVEAEGTYDADSSVLIVSECEDEHEDEDMEVKCEAVNNAIIPDETNPKVGSVECGFSGTVGGPLTIKFNDSPDMAMFYGDSTDSAFDLTDVLSGDCVEIKFGKDANGDYIAGLIEHEGAGCSSQELEGPLDSFNDGSDITALGITFTVTQATSYDPGTTGLVAGAEVSIKDIGADGTADEVELEDEDESEDDDD
jgi:hypothetical protein